MDTVKIMFKNMLQYAGTFVKWVLVAAVIGLVGGALGSVFHISIDKATELRMEFPWILYGLPLGGLIIVFLYQLAKKQGKIDTNRVLDAVKKDENVPFVMAPLIFISTVITHLFGGSAGREGAALQLGGSIGYKIGKVCRLNEDSMHIVVMAGMSAVFSALFGTPLTAAFFAIEVVRVGIVQYAALVPCVTAALVAFGMAQKFGLSPVHFDFIIVPALSADVVIRVAVLGGLLAVVGILFCMAMHACEHLAEKFLPNKYVRVIVGAMIIILLTWLSGTQAYNGAGMDVITKALSGEANPLAFLIKILFTAITIAAGFKGGEIVPAFFIGSTFGCVCGTFLGLPAGMSAALGFIALFCSVVNCPVASLLLSVEVFGAGGIILFAVVCAVSYMLSGCFGLYRSQTIMYSKLDLHPLQKAE